MYLLVAPQATERSITTIVCQISLECNLLFAFRLPAQEMHHNHQICNISPLNVTIRFLSATFITLLKYLFYVLPCVKSDSQLSNTNTIIITLVRACLIYVYRRGYYHTR